ncbi:MAG: 50S ribosome-binding GTPase [Candidatus Diapherotrites archaeon]|nr:50S ribosome-binding GTPase [Candidatus Diapherotrites archaeon]
MELFRHAINAIKEANIVLEVLDARFPAQTRNVVLEKNILLAGKVLVFVLNKSDLVGTKKAGETKKELSKTAPCYFVSAQKHLGTKRLRKELFKIAAKKRVKIAVIGYPNTGKSSLLNALAGRKAARTSAQPGFTRGSQFVRISENAQLVDSPGIIPFEQRSEFELMLVAAKSPNQLRDIEGMALQLIEWLQKQGTGALKKEFGIPENETDSEKILEEIAAKKKRLSRGGKPDTSATAMLLIKEWQEGKIKI